MMACGWAFIVICVVVIAAHGWAFYLAQRDDWDD